MSTFTTKYFIRNTSKRFLYLQMSNLIWTFFMGRGTDPIKSVITLPPKQAIYNRAKTTDNQPHQLPKQHHAEGYTQQAQNHKRRKHRWRTLAGFREGCSTTEHIKFSTSPESFLQHQQDLYHVFIDFKKAFDRVWYTALWSAMQKNNHQCQPCSLWQSH